MTHQDLQAADLPTIRHWKIMRSGAGLRIHGSIEGEISSIKADEVICAVGIIYALRDGASVGILATSTPGQAITA